MPRIVPTSTSKVSSLPELIEEIENSRLDPRDEDAFCALGPHLKALQNNRTFLADLTIAELKERCVAQRKNNYGAQVMLLHRSKNYFVRANMWPSEQDSVYKTSGPDPFFYYYPHDHNFNFLTVGYLGPGYWSDYYEYDYENVVGTIGEPAGLRFVEKAKLDLGKVMLYRAHRDIHSQLPPDSFSISLNIMEATDRQSFTDQYRFDIPSASVSGMLSFTALEPLIDLAAHIGGEAGADMLKHFSRHHPSARIQARALRARASAATSPDGAIAVMEEGARANVAFVRDACRRQIANIEGAQPWIHRASV